MQLMGLEGLAPKPGRSAKCCPGRGSTVLRGSGSRPGEPGLGDRHHVHPVGQRSFVSTSWPSSTGTRARSCPGGCRTPWTLRSASKPSREALQAYGQPETFQLGPGRAVHQRSLHPGVLLERGVKISMDGKRSPRQRVRRTPLARPEVRGLPARLRPARRLARHQRVPSILQLRPPSPGLEESNR